MYVVDDAIVSKEIHLLEKERMSWIGNLINEFLLREETFDVH